MTLRESLQSVGIVCPQFYGYNITDCNDSLNVISYQLQKQLQPNGLIFDTKPSQECANLYLEVNCVQSLYHYWSKYGCNTPSNLPAPDQICEDTCEKLVSICDPYLDPIAK